MPQDSTIDPLAHFVGYLENARQQQRATEDSQTDQKISILHDMITAPGANPARTAQALDDIMTLYASKGKGAKPKKGMAGFMGESEVPTSQILAGLIHGSIPMQGNTTEPTPKPQSPAEQGMMPEASGRLPGLQGFDGKEVLNTPVMIPPEPLQAPPEASGMLSAARDMQRYNAGPKTRPVANQPMMRSPEEMAQQEGNAAGIKVSATRDATHDSDIKYWRSVGFSDDEIKQMLRQQVVGTSGQMQDADGGFWKLSDGTSVRATKVFDPRTGQTKLVNSMTGLSLPPDAQPGAAPSASSDTDPTSYKEYERYLKDETDHGNANVLTYDKWLTMDANRKRSNTTVINRNDKGFSGPQQFAAATKLQAQWNKESKAYGTMMNQFELMKQGLQQARMGNLNSGSQAILVTFQKILDPNSVVRESEYARSPEGLGLMNRMEGAIDRMRNGGAGVPIQELEGFVSTGNAFIRGLKNSLNSAKGQIDKAAQLAGIDPGIIYGNSTGLPEQENAPQIGDKTTAQNGKVLYFDGIGWTDVPVVPAPPKR